jgi:hypothetical protein
VNFGISITGGFMITLSLAKLKPGMVLAEPAYNFQGVLLLDAGAKLTENSIRVLKSWGVARICVVGSDKKKNDRMDPGTVTEVRRLIEKGLEKKFSDLPKDDPVVTEIMRVALNLLEKRAIMKEDPNENR